MKALRFLLLGLAICLASEVKAQSSVYETGSSNDLSIWDGYDKNDPAFVRFDVDVNRNKIIIELIKKNLNKVLKRVIVIPSKSEIHNKVYGSIENDRGILLIYEENGKRKCISVNPGLDVVCIYEDEDQKRRSFFFWSNIRKEEEYRKFRELLNKFSWKENIVIDKREEHRANELDLILDLLGD